MDASSELIHSLLPLLLVGTLGVGPILFGVIEGVAEAAVMFPKVISGPWSDRLGRRKPLVVAGYGLAAAVKPLFPLAGGGGMVFLARLLDRVAKGVRGAPRDALIADVTSGHLRGAAYGLRQALDSAGAVLGPAAAFVLMTLLDGDLRATLWWAVVPAALAVMVLLVFVREPPARPMSADVSGKRPRIDWRAVRSFERGYWLVVGIGIVFTLARFSEGFLLLRALDLGIDNRHVPLVLAGMSAVFAVSAYPAGWLSDRLGRGAILALATSAAALGVGVALWGFHLGLTQGVLSALVADAAPSALRGTGFGLFSLGSGLALLLASLFAGLLWQLAGPAATFWTGAAFALSSAALVASRRLVLGRRRSD